MKTDLHWPNRIRLFCCYTDLNDICGVARLLWQLSYQSFSAKYNAWRIHFYVTLSLVSIFIFRRYLWSHIFKFAISVFPFISIFSVCLFVQSCKSSDFPTPLQSSKCRKCCCGAKFVKLNLPPTKCHYFWVVNTLYQNLRTNRTLFSTPSSFWTRVNNSRSRATGFEPVSLESWVLYSSSGGMPWRTLAGLFWLLGAEACRGAGWLNGHWLNLPNSC